MTTNGAQRLRKVDVERMMATYDDDPVSSLTTALQVVLGLPGEHWTALVRSAGFTCARRIRLQALEMSALDELLAELNEMRAVVDVRR